MMQSEFENLLGHSVDYAEYEKIETVYMCFEKMTKQEIADFYKRDGQFLTTKLYEHVLDVDRTITKKNAKIDDLRKDLKNTCEVVENMVAENDQLRKENNYLKEMSFNLTVKGYKNENSIEMLESRIEDLETQLQQYKALFADIEKNATVALYETLLGIKE